MVDRPVAATALLYSGGMDSFILAWLYRPEVLVHVDMGTAYGAVEAGRLRAPHGIPLVRCALDLSAWEDPVTFIIPGRNLHLVLCGAQYGDEVWLGATAGDRNLDKDEAFAARASHLLEYMYGAQSWLPAGRQVRVALPGKDYTKRQLVRMYLDAGGDPAELVGTLSCYTPTAAGEHCGQCKACVRKWVACTAEGVVLPYDARAGAVRDAETGEGWGSGTPGWSELERQDVMDALERVGAR